MAVKPSTGKSRVKRLKAGAPLAQGVKGKAQALGNMTAQDREVAQLKSKVRAINPNKGKPGGNIVNKTTGVITGSTKKAAKFTK